MSQPYGMHARLGDQVLALTAALALWQGRDDTRPQPHVRRAANEAMDTIDEMLRELYAMRSRLVTQIRAADDATGRRVDALLTEGPVPDEEEDDG
jgi:hypothetical protein